MNDAELANPRGSISRMDRADALIVAKPFGVKNDADVANDSMIGEDRAQRWVQTWKGAGDALARVKAMELRELSEERSGELALTFTFDPATTWRSPDRRDAQGLIEQQRYFMKHHEHPIRHRSRARAAEIS